MHVRVFLGFLGGQVGKVAAVHIIGLAGGEQVQRYGAELKRRAALQKQDFIIVRHIHQLLEERFGAVEDFDVHAAAVAHLHDAHAASGITNQFISSLFEHAFGDHRGTCGKIIYAFLHVIASSLFDLLGFRSSGTIFALLAIF